MVTKRNSIIVGTVLLVVVLGAYFSSNPTTKNGPVEGKKSLVASNADTLVNKCTLLCEKYVKSEGEEQLMNDCVSDCQNPPQSLSQCVSGCVGLCDKAFPAKKGACQKDCVAGCKKGFPGFEMNMDDPRPLSKQCSRHLRTLALTTDLSKAATPQESGIPFSADAVFGFTDAHNKLKTMSVQRAFAERRHLLSKNFGTMHKMIPFGPDLVLFVYKDNGVVMANTRQCQVKGVYDPTPSGEVDPRVRLAVKSLATAKSDGCSGSCLGGSCDCNCCCVGSIGGPCVPC